MISARMLRAAAAECAACGRAFTDKAWRCEALTFCDEACAEHYANSGLRRIERLARAA
jgi:hypothetical protein